MAIAAMSGSLVLENAYASKLFNPDYCKNWSAEIDRAALITLLSPKTMTNVIVISLATSTLKKRSVQKIYLPLQPYPLPLAEKALDLIHSHAMGLQTMEP